MQIKVLTETPERTVAAVFDRAEEAAAGLLQIAVVQNLTATRLTGIGALSRVVLPRLRPRQVIGGASAISTKRPARR